MHYHNNWWSHFSSACNKTVLMKLVMFGTFLFIWWAFLDMYVYFLIRHSFSFTMNFASRSDLWIIKLIGVCQHEKFQWIENNHKWVFKINNNKNIRILTHCTHINGCCNWKHSLAATIYKLMYYFSFSDNLLWPSSKENWQHSSYTRSIDTKFSNKSYKWNF